MPQFDTAQPISVVLELRAADVRVSASERTDTTVQVRPSDPSMPEDVTAAEETRVEYSDGTLVVKEPRRSRGPRLRQQTSKKQLLVELEWSPFSDTGSIDVEIELPAGSDLKASTAAGDLSCTGPLGRCELKSSAGDISVERVTMDFDLATSTGDVRAGVVEGAAQIKNANGDTRIREVGGDLAVNTANGDVEVERAGGGVTVKTANGDIRIDNLQSGSLLAESGRGDIDVGVADGVAAWLDLDTGFGDVDNQLEAAQRPASDEQTVEILARTGFGDITIRRAQKSAESWAAGSGVAPEQDA
jgi:DUF4097 and DUF4098 domain-containing protein YvlB